MPDAFRYLLCSKLCQHNRLVPTLWVNLIKFFELSSGYTAFADDALNVNKMNVCTGGT